MAQFTEVQQYPKSVLGETCRIPGSRRSSLHRAARSRGSSLSRSTYKVPWLRSAVLHIGHGCNMGPATWRPLGLKCFVSTTGEWERARRFFNETETTLLNSSTIAATTASTFFCRQIKDSLVTI
jgi:hypothetical protein